ncbi:hypothetical protein ACG7TL_003370 [Trametes sanguinea]
MEGLLNLFARALPSTQNSSAGREKRTAYIHSVFKSCAPPEVASAGLEIAEILENVPTSNWDETALKIVDVMSRANITYPQPFTTQEVVACGYTYPSDRLYADDKTFLANVLLGDDQYDSLEIAYSAVTEIIGQHTQPDTMQITLSLNEYPKLGKDRLKPKNHTGAELEGIEATFRLNALQFDRFVGALASRGLAHLVADRRKSLYMPKLSLAATPARLEIDSSGRFAPELSQEERIETVSQFYKTDEASEDIACSEDADACNNTVPVCNSATHVPVLAASASTNVPLRTQLTGHENLSNGNLNVGTSIGTSIKALFDSDSATDAGKRRMTLMHAAAFGLSDEELSEISDDDSPLPPPRSRVLKRSDTSASLVRGRISFQPLPKTDLGVGKSATRLTRSAIGNVVLDSDEDSPPGVPISTSARQNRKSALIPKATLDDSQTDCAMIAGSDRLVAAVPVAQVVSSSLHGDETLVSSDIPGKVLRFSDIPAPDFNAALSSPIAMAKSALKSALARRPTKSQTVALSLQELGCDPPARDTHTSVYATTDVRDEKGSRTTIGEILDDLVPPSSSPTPATKKSIKANLRNRTRAQHNLDEMAVPTVTTGTVIAKRKSPIQDDGDVQSPDNGPKRPNKRVRKSAASDSSKQPLAGESEANSEAALPDEQPASRALSPPRVAPKHITRKYHARKERTPLSGVARKRAALNVTKAVDYDALPSPPRTSGTAIQFSSPATKIKKAAKAKQETHESPAPICDSGGAPDGNDRSTTKGAKVSLRTPQTGPAHAAKSKFRRAATGNVKDCTIDAGHSVGGRDTKSAPSPLSITHDSPTINSAEKTSGTEHSGIDVPATSSVQAAVTVHAESSLAPSEGAPLERHAPCDMKIMGDDESKGAEKHSSATPWDAATESANLDEDTIHMVEIRPQLAPGDETVCVSRAQMAIDHGTADSHDHGTPAASFSSSPSETESVHVPSKQSIADPHKDDPVSKLATQPVVAPRSGNAVSTSDTFASKVKNGVETIDLTVDSPFKPRARSSLSRAHQGNMPMLSTPVTDHSTTMIASRSPKPHKIPIAEEHHDVLTYLQNANLCMQEEASRRLLPFSEKQLHVDLKGNDIQDRMHKVLKHGALETTFQNDRDTFEQRHTRLARRSEDDRLDTPVQDIMKALMRLHEVILDNMENNFESVRHGARLGRNELLRKATADLETLRAQSVEHFNMLVDLEAEYATAGRGLIQGSEDWIKINGELARGVKQVVEQHDRVALSKKMPSSLIVLTF